MKSSYGKWTIIDGPFEDGKWLCRCECGTEKKVSGVHLRFNRSTACRKCGSSSPWSEIGRMFSSVPKNVYKKLRQASTDAARRCANPTDGSYENYGERGIKVNFPSDAAFIAYLLTLPGHDDATLFLDRIDNDGSYEPGNLRFITHQESNANMRHPGSPILTEEQIAEAVQLRAQNPKFWTYRRLGKRYGVTPSAVWMAATGKTWKHLQKAR